MSITYDVVCRNTLWHSPVTVAQIVDEEVLGQWRIIPGRLDLSRRNRPRDGYVFRCRSCDEHAECHRDDLHQALHRLGADGRRVISLDGIRYLRRLREDPVRPPQPIQPLADAGGFLMSGETP